MKILIIEDDLFKSNDIKNLLLSSRFENLFLEICSNVFDAVKYIRGNDDIDKIILDMSLPSHPSVVGQGSSIPMATGGIEILFKLKFFNMRNIPVLILTQYDTIEVEKHHLSFDDAKKELKNIYKISELDVVGYSITSIDWHQSILDFIGG